jgi:hypothetical protein
MTGWRSTIPEVSSDKRFLGGAIFDMDESADAELFIQLIVKHAWQLGINPGGTVLIQDVTGNSRILHEHKNKLITDDQLLLQLGSNGRKHLLGSKGRKHLS